MLPDKEEVEEERGGAGGEGRVVRLFRRDWKRDLAEEGAKSIASRYFSINRIITSSISLIEEEVEDEEEEVVVVEVEEETDEEDVDVEEVEVEEGG